MPEETVIPLTPDDAQKKIDGVPGELDKDGSVTIVGTGVNVGNDLVEVDGVLEGNKLEEIPAEKVNTLRDL